MIDNPFRDILPRYVEPLIAFYRKLGVTPNQITVAAFAVACVAALCAAWGFNLLAIGIWWLGRLLDGTDGIYARSTNQASAFGAYLDIVCDMASYSIMAIGLSFQFPEVIEVWVIILFFYVLCITSALSLGSLEREHRVEGGDNRGLRLGAGLAEGGETGIAYTLFLLFPADIILLAWFWVLILATTVIARTLLARRVLP